MNKRLIKNFIGLICIFIVLLISSPSFADFKFVVMGDSRGYEDGINTKVLRTVLEQVTSEGAEFIVFVGDLITGSRDSGIHRERLTKWKTIVEEYGIPAYIVIGNHEIESEKSEETLRSIFEMPENGPPDLIELVYSFDYKNTHFVAIDTDIYNNFHRLGNTQLEWLKEDLGSPRKEIIFVFGHDPAYPIARHKKSSLDKYPYERDELWNIFQEYGVSVYFCGHEHLYNRSLHKGVYQIITAGCGAHLDKGPKKGGFYHFILVDVKDDGTCEFTVKDIEGTIKDILRL